MQRENSKHRARGWIRAISPHTEKAQRAALEPICGALYSAADADGLDDLLRSLRPGDLVVVTTLGRLARRWGALVDLLEAIHKKRAAVLETTTGRRSDDAAAVVSLLDDARAEQISEAKGLTPRRAKAAAGKRWAAERERRMPDAEAERIWKHDRRYPTGGEAIEAMTGWSLSAAYRQFGPRGIGAGRPKRKK